MDPIGQLADLADIIAEAMLFAEQYAADAKECKAANDFVLFCRSNSDSVKWWRDSLVTKGESKR